MSVQIWTWGTPGRQTILVVPTKSLNHYLEYIQTVICSWSDRTDVLWQISQRTVTCEGLQFEDGFLLQKL